MLFAVPTRTLYYPVFAGNFLGMANGASLRSLMGGKVPALIGKYCLIHLLSRDTPEE